MKRFWMIFIMIALLAGFCVASASAESGTYEGLSWDLTDGVLTLGDGGTQTMNVNINRTAASWPWNSARSSITSVVTQGTINFRGSLSSMFSGCSKLVSVDTSGWNTGNVTSFYFMFAGCSKLTELDVSGFDTGSATTFECMFQSCSSLTSLDTSLWNMARAIYIGSIFVECSKLVSVGVESWNVSNVTEMNHVFSKCRALTTLDLSGWDTANVIRMNNMFDSCDALETLNISGWSTGSVENMALMFSYCGALTSVDVSSFDTSHVQNMNGMFSGCSSLTTLDVSGWNTIAVTNMSQMFRTCGKLQTLDVSGWDTRRVTLMPSMFAYCTSLTGLDVSGWRTPRNTSVSYMFKNCSSLTELDVSNFDTHLVVAMNYTFSGCSKVPVLDVSGWNTSKADTMEYMFDGCSKVQVLDVDEWDTSNVKTMTSMFNGCSSLQTLDVSGFNTNNVTSMRSMFCNCAKLETIDVSGWNTSLVTEMAAMFQGCKKVKVLDLSHFDTHLVSSFNQMFTDVKSVSVLDLSSFDTRRVTTMRLMFDGCRALEVCDVSSFNTQNVTEITSMFDGCASLKKLDLSGFNLSSATEMTHMFYDTAMLSEIILGNYNPFVGANGKTTTLYAHLRELDGVRYTAKWIREDETAGPYTPEELRDNYVASMTGKWVWEKVPTTYTITFVCTEADYLGDTPQVTAPAAEDYVLPLNGFRVFGKVFDHWTDGTRRIYADGATIPANTYAANAVVTLTAVFEPRNTSIMMENGEFMFSIKGDEKAFFGGIPSGTSYQVFEENLPEDWVLIQQYDSTGLIYPLEEAQALFLNKYQPDMATMQFTGRKLMDGQPATAGSFAFELWEGNVLLQTKSVVDGGFVQFDILEYDRTDEGVHMYTIKELIGTDETLLYDGHEETIAVEVTTDTSAEDNIVRVHAEVTYSDGTYPDIVFQNWTKPGELILTKLVDDLLADHEGDEFRFRITFKQENGLPLTDEMTYTITP